MYRVLLLHFTISLKVCPQINTFKSPALIAARYNKLHSDSVTVSHYGTKQGNKRIDNERRICKYVDAHKLDKTKTHGQFNNETWTTFQKSTANLEYNCKNHEYCIGRIREEYIENVTKGKESMKAESILCDPFDGCEFSKSFNFTNYKAYISNQQYILRQEYRKEYIAEKMQHVIDSFVIQNFPTSFHITDHSYGDDFLMKINLDYIEKLVNYAAATRKSIKLQKALEMYDELTLIYKPTAHFLLQMGHALALSYALDLHIGPLEVFNKAIATYNKILGLENVSEEDFERAANHMVDLLQSRRMFIKAIHIQKQLDTKNVYSTDMIDRLAEMYMYIGDKRSARQMFEKSLKLRPNNWLALFMLGHLLHFDDTTSILQT